MSAGIEIGRAAALLERIQAFDNDPRTIRAGALAGAMLAILMAAGIDAQVHLVAWVIVGLALLAPSSGLTVIAVLAVLREPAGLGPLGFNATVTGACGLGVVARMLLAGLAGRRFAIRPEFVAIGAFLALSMYQYLRVVARVSDERERFGRTQLTDVAAGLLLIVLVAVVFNPRGRALLVAAMIPGIVFAAIAAIASLSPDVLRWLPIGGLLPATDVSVRGTGIFYNPNYLGQAMAMGAILVARSGTLGLPGWLARWAPLLAIPVGLAALASFSRGAVLALVAAIVSLYASRGRRALAIAAAVGVLSAAIGYQVVLVVRHAMTWGDQVELSGAAQALSDSARLNVHLAGLRLFLREPVMGIGVGQFHFESPLYMNGSAITYPHDSYLQVAAEQGLLGIAAFLVLLLLLFRALRRGRDAYALTAMSMLVAFAVGSLFAEPMTNPQTSFILWLAVGAALVSRQNPEDAGSSDRRPEQPPFRMRAPASLLPPQLEA